MYAVYFLDDNILNLGEGTTLIERIKCALMTRPHLRHSRTEVMNLRQRFL